MPKSQTRRVIFQPAAYHGFQKGINQIVDAVHPTLGPLPRVVALEPQAGRDRFPELLDEGGVIARRIIQVADPDADMGAMFIRQLLWRLHESVGDGTATAAVLLRSIFNQGVRYIAAGGNAMLLRRHLEAGVPVILDRLDEMATLVQGKEKLAQIAESICYDPPLAKLLGEILDIVGEHGRIETRSGRTRGLEREYVQGMYWDKSGVFSRQMITDKTRLRTDMENAAILISDCDVDGPREMVPAIEAAMEAEYSSLLIVARTIADGAMPVLLSDPQNGDKLQIVAVKTPGATVTAQAAVLEDLAYLTGGRPVVKAAGDTLSGVRPQDLGRARKVWADRYNFGIIGGRGDPRALRNHIASLRSAFGQAKDAAVRKELQQRIGKLLGGAATLYVGAATELELKARKALADRTASALRTAITDGVLPGGGIALLACRPAVQELLEASSDPGERAAYRILIKALEAPARAIIGNAGYDASEVMAEIRLAGPGYGFDARGGQVVDMIQAGIYDLAGVQKAAVYGAVSSAALALTVDVLVHHKTPPQAVTP